MGLAPWRFTNFVYKNNLYVLNLTSVKIFLVVIEMTLRFILSLVVLLVYSDAFASTLHVRNRLLEGISPSKRLHLKRLPVDFFVMDRPGVIVERMSNGGFLVCDSLKEKHPITTFREIHPMRRQKLLRLPNGFFPEDRDDVSVENIDGRMLLVRENRQLERSRELYKRTINNLGLLGKKDRRVLVPNSSILPFSAISFLRLTYTISPGTQFVFYGTGFRNSENQILTAGHNLKLDEKEIENSCHEKGIFSKDYSFKKENYAIEIIFGLQGSSCTYFTKLSAKDAYLHSSRDFGLVPLSKKEALLLDESVGALGLTLLPDSPKELKTYLNKSVMIAGYPGEKKPHRLYKHSGKIKGIDVDGVVSYNSDTTPGNSGSPGFLFSKSKKLPVSSACLVHTHQTGKLNAGEKMDADLVTFMTKFL